MSKVFNIEFGPYRLVINATNSDQGVIPLINVLRDKHYNHIKECNEYKQVWSGDMVAFYDLMEKATRPAWIDK